MRGASPTPSCRRHRIALVLTVVGATWTFVDDRHACAADRSWTNPAGGTFAVGANWSGGVAPATFDNAIFNLNNTYTVRFGASLTNANLTASSGTATIGQVGTLTTFYSLTGNATATGAGTNFTISGVNVDVGGQVAVGNGARMTIANSVGFLGMSHAGNVQLGRGGTGTLSVAEAWLDAAGAAPSLIGNNGATGTLLVSDGLVDFNSRLGLADSTIANSGAQVRLNSGDLSAATLVMATGGAAGQFANVVVDNFSEFQATYATVGTLANSTATITVGNDGLARFGDLTLNPTGRIAVNAGGRLWIGDGVRHRMVVNGGSVSVAAGAEMEFGRDNTIQAGGDVDVLGTL